MQFVKQLGQEEVANSKHRWSKFFDKKGNDHGIPHRVGHRLRTEYANYVDFYYAMGNFVGKSVLEKYRKRVEFFATLEALYMPGVVLGSFLAVISIPLAFITGGQGWPDWLINAAILIGMGPMFGFMFFHLFVASSLTTYMANSFYKEWEKKKTAPITSKPRRKGYWALMILFSFFVIVGMLANDWIGMLFFPTWVLGSIVYGLFEGFILVAIWTFFSRLLPKKTDPASQVSIPPRYIRQMRHRMAGVYHALRKGDYAAAYTQFEESEVSEEEFQYAIQAYLTEHDLDRLHLPNTREQELELDITALSKKEYDVEFSFSDAQVEKFSDVYLFCHVTYAGNKIEKVTLLEAGYD